MKKSLFIAFVASWFVPLVNKIVEEINGSKNPLTYLFKTMLSPKYSPNLKWGSLRSNGSIVAADIVAMDSELPLKKRDSLQQAEGDIPKSGMKLYLNERTLSDLDILQRTNQDGNRTNAILKLLFADSKKCVTGVYERLEYMFLEALSTGVTVVEDADNTGVGVRIDFGHPDDNKYGASVPWSDPNAKPIDDIENVLENARQKGDAIRYIFMDRAAWKNFRNRAQVKELFAASIGFTGTSIPTPNLKQVNAALDEDKEVTIQLVDRSVVFEKNGKRTAKRPWAKNTAVFLTSLDVGDLAYGTLAEENHPVEGVTYAKADDFILLSKYHKNDPLREYTSSQGLVVPVINGVDSIYIMDTEEAATDAQTEDDANFDYEGVSYTKVSVVAALNEAKPGTNATTNWKDSTLLNRINKLSDEEIEVFEDNIVEAV